MEKIKSFKQGVIYKYTSPSGKIYIGQTINEKSRKNQHKRTTIKTDTKFGKALRKYGYENFEYSVIIKFNFTTDLHKLKRVLNKLEDRYIKLYDCVKLGYNLSSGGDSRIPSEETIEKMREIGNNMTDEHKEKLSIADKIKFERDGFPDETKAKLSNSLKEYFNTNPFNEEIKEKLRNTTTNNNRKRRVSKLNDKLEVIETYDSIADAAKSISSSCSQKSKSTHISECCSGKRKSAYTYFWVFEVA